MKKYDDWLSVITDEHNIGCIPRFDSEGNIINCCECSIVGCDDWDLYNEPEEEEEVE